MFVILETQVSVAYPGFPSRGTYYLAKYLPKTAWKWKKLDRERCVCPLSPFGSVTRSIPAFEAFSYNGITSNDSPFGCPIIYTDTNSQRYFVHRHPNNAWHNNVHSVIVMPCLTKITSNRIFCIKIISSNAKEFSQMFKPFKSGPVYFYGNYQNKFLVLNCNPDTYT